MGNLKDHLDTIEIKGLRFNGRHGVHREEKEKGAPFIYDVVYTVDEGADPLSDDIRNTVSYSDVVRLIKDINCSASYDLIETLADVSCIRILEAFPKVYSVSVRVSKPEAPVTEEFSDIAAIKKRNWEKIAVSFGGNQGDTKNISSDAFDAIKGNKAIRNIKISDLIKTKPYGYKDQPDFLNGCFLAETYLSPRELLRFLNEIEAENGRERTIRWGPRTLDLDIILYGDICINEEDLVIPHIDFRNRRFVLEPLSDIGGYLKDPVTGKTIDLLYKELKKKGFKE